MTAAPSTQRSAASVRALWRVSQAADWLGLSESSVRNEIRNGHLPAYQHPRLERVQVIRGDDLDAYVETITAPAPALRPLRHRGAAA